MFERFTDEARRVVVLAQEEARMLDHNYIGTEHLLLGLLHEGKGLGAKALGSLNVSLEAARRLVEEMVGRGQAAPPGHVPFTPRAKKVLESSFREASARKHSSFSRVIDTEHILLGIIDTGGVASRVLEAIGLSSLQVRAAVADALANEAEIESDQGSTGGEVEESPMGRPCPGCSEPLEDTVEYYALEVPSDSGEEPSITVHVVSCGACGYILGIAP